MTVRSRNTRSSPHHPSMHPPAVRPACPAETMILFCLEMDKDLFSGTRPEISRKVRDFVTKIRGVEDDLASALKSGGFDATPVRSVILSDGTIKGELSLPHCAADAGLGEIGDNRLLISYRHGCRIGLGAVVTSIGMEETPRPEPSGETCNHCKKCIRACPEHALSPGTLDLSRCRNVTGPVPGFVLPGHGPVHAVRDSYPVLELAPQSSRETQGQYLCRLPDFMPAFSSETIRPGFMNTSRGSMV